LILPQYRQQRRAHLWANSVLVAKSLRAASGRVGGCLRIIGRRCNPTFLVLTGALDDVTPPRYGEKAARSFTNAHTLVLPNRSHNDIDPCVSGIITDFVNAGSAKNLDSSCLAKTEDLSFALRADQLIN
jgi:hypothetical protein